MARKLSSGARNLLLLMSTKKAVLAVAVAVVEKCRELWGGLVAGSRRHPDDGYFGRSYEFSCSATPVIVPAKSGGGGGRRRRRRGRCLMPLAFRECWSPDRSPQCRWVEHEIDGLAEEFIKRFREQLRLQELRLERKTTPSSSPCHMAPAGAAVN